MRIPIACTLTAVDAGARVEEWRSLLQATVRGVARPSPTRVELAVGGTPEQLGALVDLARREKACCAFFDFTFTVAAEGVTLAVSVPADAAPVLANFADLVPARARGPAEAG